MKLKYSITLVLGLLASFHLLVAQEAGPGAAMQGHFWLQNGDKQIKDENKDSVSRSFFAQTPIMLLCSRKALPDEQFFCVIQTTDRPAVAFLFERQELTPEVLKRINEAETGSTVTFGLQPKMNSGRKATSPDLFISLSLK